jgi:hypothetical protein
MFRLTYPVNEAVNRRVSISNEDCYTKLAAFYIYAEAHSAYLDPWNR